MASLVTQWFNKSPLQRAVGSTDCIAGSSRYRTKCSERYTNAANHRFDFGLYP